MRHALRLTTLGPVLASALLMLAASGCASRLFHRGGATTLTAPAAADAVSKPQDKSQDRPRKEKKHKQNSRDQSVPSNFSGDPLAEARVRAVENPNDPWWPCRAAQLEAAAGHTAAAETSLLSALARDSAYAPALTRLSRLFYEQGRHEDAVRLLTPVRERRVTLSATDRAAVLAGLALHESALGNDDGARAVMGMLSHGDHDDAVGVAAYLAVRTASPDSASKLTEAAIKIAPESAANHNNRGIALLRSADPEGAAREFARAMTLDPALPGPYYNMAILERWYRLDPVAATKRFQQYWTRSHSDPDSLFAELGHGSPTPVTEEGRNR